jgi:hypothetical protein
VSPPGLGILVKIAQENTVANDQLNGRTIVNLPSSAGDLRGPARTIALTAEARALADAIVSALDRIHLFELDGALVLLAGRELHGVNGQVLREVLRANFATKHIVVTGAGLGVEYRPVEVSELVVRTLLTAPPQQGGLVERVPAAAMEAPRQVLEEVAVGEGVEFEAGQRALARHAGEASGERTQQEIERGQQRVKELRNG